MLDEDVGRVGAAVERPAAVVDGRDVAGQGGVAGLLDEPAAEALVLEDFQPVEAERQEPGPGPGQLVGPQDDALVEDGVEFTALEPSVRDGWLGMGWSKLISPPQARMSFRLKPCARRTTSTMIGVMRRWNRG